MISARVVRGGPISFTCFEANFTARLSRKHCRKRRRRKHGALPPRIPRVRSAVPSRVCAYPRRQENPRAIFDACMTAMAQVTPTLNEFVELAKHGNVIPVFAEFIA